MKKLFLLISVFTTGACATVDPQPMLTKAAVRAEWVRLTGYKGPGKPIECKGGATAPRDCDY